MLAFTVTDVDRKLYEGTKRLYAWPLTRGQYNEYRGWETPHDEDATEPGYLVEYTDGGKPNHPAHEGYVSWSPAEVFEATYREVVAIGDWRTRVLVEHADLSTRLSKLSAFLDTEAFNALPRVQQELMRVQFEYMKGYANVLEQRLNVSTPLDEIIGDDVHAGK